MYYIFPNLLYNLQPNGIMTVMLGTIKSFIAGLIILCGIASFTMVAQGDYSQFQYYVDGVWMNGENAKIVAEPAGPVWSKKVELKYSPCSCSGGLSVDEDWMHHDALFSGTPGTAYGYFRKGDGMSTYLREHQLWRFREEDPWQLDPAGTWTYIGHSDE